VSVVTEQWLFIQANSKAAAKRYVISEYVEGDACDWAHITLTNRPIVHGIETRSFAQIVASCKKTQRIHLGRLAEYVKDTNWQQMVHDYEPYAPVDTSLPNVMEFLASQLGGAWTPYSGGYDTVADTSLLYAVKQRMRDASKRQYAIAVEADF